MHDICTTGYLLAFSLYLNYAIYLLLKKNYSVIIRKTKDVNFISRSTCNYIVGGVPKQSGILCSTACEMCLGNQKSRQELNNGLQPKFKYSDCSPYRTRVCSYVGRKGIGGRLRYPASAKNSLCVRVGPVPPKGWGIGGGFTMIGAL